MAQTVTQIAPEMDRLSPSRGEGGASSPVIPEFAKRISGTQEQETPAEIVALGPGSRADALDRDDSQARIIDAHLRRSNPDFIYRDRSNPRADGVCDSRVTPVHKGAGRKRVAIDPPEAVVQGRQRVVPLQPELW